jgi:hypothetical protein
MDHFLSVYYFTLLLLHFSANVCHLHEAHLHLLSYMPIWVLVDQILCGTWLCVFYVAAWCVPIYRSICISPPHNIHTTTYYTEFYQQNPNWHETQKVQTISLRMAHSCRNMWEQLSEIN